LEKESLGKSLLVALDGLVENLRGDAVERGQIGVENDTLVPDSDDELMDVGIERGE
jgi:hypothetical protein